MELSEIKNLVEAQGDAFKDFADRISMLEAKQSRAALFGHNEPNASREAKQAFSHFVRKGQMDESKGLSTGVDADGGYALPGEIDAEIESLLVQISPMRQLARVVTATTSDFRSLVNLRGTVSGWVGETAARAETDTPDLAEIAYPSGEIYAFPFATQRAVEDLSFDVEGWLQQQIVDEFAYQEGAAFISGNGTNKPQGILSYATAATADGVRAFGTLQHVVTGAASAFPNSNAGDVLINLAHSLRAGYRQGAAWLMNTATLSAISKFKDGQGNYLWNPSVAAGTPSTLLGYPVYEDSNVPDIAANAFPVIFGNFQRGYTIVDRTGISVLRDPYSVKGKIGYYARKRVSGAVVNSEAIKLLKVSA